MENQFDVFCVLVVVDVVYFDCVDLMHDDFSEALDGAALDQFGHDLGFEGLDESWGAVIFELRELHIDSFKLASQWTEEFSECFIFFADLSDSDIAGH